MIDREKIIKGLECCSNADGIECPDCPFRLDNDCIETLSADALTMLKEQSEIVRCKTCKWYSEKGFCKHPNGGAGNVRPADWFCADGERKE